MPEQDDSRNRSSRRDFLTLGGAVMLGSSLPQCIPGRGTMPAIALASSTFHRPETRPASALTQQASIPAPNQISVHTLSQAERLARIGFIDEQRTVMLETIGDQLRRFEQRHAHPFPPNSLAPAQTFDPRLPDADFSHLIDVVRRSDADPGPLPENDEDIAFAPVVSLSRWIERRELTSARLTSIYLERLRQYDPILECVITYTEDLALLQAERADREISAGHYRGPLHGIPWGAKDLLDTQGIETTWGATPYIDRLPDRDATVVKMLEEAGAVLVAKLTLGEIAYNDIWFGGRTNNPWNPEQGSSGSSAGSAATVAAGLVGFSIGTETYGSIVSPCMRCGTTGLRPTFGRVPRSGAMALCWSLDKIGPICRTVEDCMLVLDAISGYDPEDASSIDMPLQFDAALPVRGMRMGYNPAWFADPVGNALDRRVLDICRTLDMQLVPVELPALPYESLLNILHCEAAAAFEELTRTGLDQTLRWQEPIAWPNTWRQSWFIPGIELVQAERLRREVMTMLAERFADLDAIISPSFAASLLLITNNTGHPSLTLRTGFHEPNRPHGITIIGRLFEEGTLCSIGMALERELDVWHERPAL